MFGGFGAPKKRKTNYFKMIFIPGQSNLKFEPTSHTYEYNGQKLTSVSSVIQQYTNKFDIDGTIVARKAEENGITVEEQKKIWQKAGDDSRERGTLFHSDVEHFIKTKRVLETPNKNLVSQFAKIKFKGMLFSEIRLFNVDFGIAGTTDLIEVFPDNSISLADYKTNQAKKMTRFSFGRKMLYPLNHTWDSVIDKYEIQISTYAYMLESAGWWVRDLTIYHIDYDKQQVKEIPMQNRRKDVIKMLDHYRSNREA